MSTIRVTKNDSFVWLLVSEKAKEIFASGLFALYVLYDDDSESLIDHYEQLDYALANGLSIGIEVGFLN
jgi:hypothetical protein